MQLGGIILAGGKSVRMGTDKSVLKINNKTLTELAYENIKPFVHQCLIVSNNPINTVGNCKTIKDEIENIGPLGGIYTGLLHSEFENNLIISCDTPFIGQEFFATVISEFSGQDAVIGKNGANIEPLIGLYSKHALGSIIFQSENKQFKMQNLLNLLNVKYVDVNKISKFDFININTKEIYELCKKK